MGLLVKCNVTNSIIPESVSNEVFITVLVKNPTKNNIKLKVTNQVNSEEHTINCSYNTNPFCMKNFTSTGITFKAKLEQFKTILDFTDKHNIKNLKLFAFSTRFKVVNIYSDVIYDGEEVFKLVNDDKYEEAWKIISENLRIFSEERIFINSYYEDEPQPICISIISKHVYDEFMSESFMKKVLNEFYYSNNDLLEDRLKLAPKIYDKLVDYKSNRKYETVNDLILRIPDSGQYILGDLYCFSRTSKDHLTRYVISNLLMSEDINEISEESLISLIEMMIYNDYMSCCFDYIQEQYDSISVCSIEDYQNYYTNQGLELKNKIFKRINLLHEE